MRKFPKPIVVSSMCFGFDACRYNGAMIPNNFVQKLEPFVKFVPICPEVEIGLGTPRDIIRVVEKNGEKFLLQPTTGKELSKQMYKFAERFLSSLDSVDGFILKSRSPSCGIKDAKVFRDAHGSMPIGKGPGLFAEKVLEKYPGFAIEDEERLKNYNIREHFLTKLYTLARFREVKKKNTVRALVDFHSENKFIFMSYNPRGIRALGRIAANENKLPIEDVIPKYEKHLQDALSKNPRRSSHINTLMHGIDYFSKKLTSKEKAYSLDLLESYRSAKIPLSAILTVLEAWIVKYDEEYLARQTFFEPYPRELMDISGSGKGRAI
ncbi:MAG: DUF523 and DUF1722 domain-containing protein [Candidatus Dadabacteria bacterium]|nr:DUF523 and DUF1722 domain-containing protein [Candidatus Dadabacteria bacterium]